ncbi:MAG: copper homeostasis protein CutC [Bacteroidales bacterium]|nr:copper homeostasis protein CutC [Bacteroidales bacterium]
MNSFEFEICANGLESCIAAQAAGATRVELCAGIPEGGTTPSFGEISLARKMLDTTKLHVIIRPRGGDFTYSPLEIERMALDISLCKEMGVDGVVFGCLTPEGDIDVEANARLLQHARGMSCTFHRAFDRCKDPMNALSQLKTLGFDRVLTSGQQPTAEAGIPLLKHLQQDCLLKPIIMAGCGVNESNIAKIHEETGVTAFHFSARENVKSATTYMSSGVAMGNPDSDESLLPYTTERRVAATINALLERKKEVSLP